MPPQDTKVIVRVRFVWYVRVILKIASIPARLPGCRWMVSPITRLAWMQMRVTSTNGKPLIRWRWFPVHIVDERMRKWVPS